MLDDSFRRLVSEITRELRWTEAVLDGLLAGVEEARCRESWEGVAQALHDARESMRGKAAAIASRRREEREERLRALGFEESSREQRRDQLAKNVALLDWPKR